MVNSRIGAGYWYVAAGWVFLAIGLMAFWGHDYSVSEITLGASAVSFVIGLVKKIAWQIELRLMDIERNIEK